MDDGGIRYRRKVAAMEGWRSAEELIGWGFAHAPVVMANETHNGLARCIPLKPAASLTSLLLSW